MSGQAGRDASGADGPVGLLIVHGIGRQAPGATLAGVLDGLRAAHPDRLTVVSDTPGHALVQGLARPVHAVEVYWADLLQGDAVRGTFDIDRLYEVVWFPSLNRRAGYLGNDVSRRGRVARWTWTLAVLSFFVQCAIFGAGLIASIVGRRRPAATRAPTATTEGRSWATSVRRFVEQARATADASAEGRSFVDDALDEVVGDILNYADGRRRSFPVDDERGRELARRVDAIRDRFEDAARQLVERHGCREIQVLAHSLGTVIAFNAMTVQGAAVDDGHAARITRFHTIGSPLEKFRFFWTPLLAGSDGGPRIAARDRVIASGTPGGGDGPMRWENFRSPLDLVSGRLRPFPGWPEPVDHRLAGLGGVLSSHLAYRAHPAFLERLVDGFGGPPPRVATSFWRRLRSGLGAALQNLLAPVAILLLVAIGFGLMVTVGWATGWLIGEPFSLLGLDGVARGIRYWVVGSVVVSLGAGVLIGRGRAKILHARYWAPQPEADVRSAGR